MPTNSNVLVIGGSRNIGYLSALRLLQRGSRVTFLLRSPKCFDDDTEIQPFVKNGMAILIKGDATVEADVRNAWEQAANHGNVDLCLFTVGGVPKIGLMKGVYMETPNLVTQCMMNLICTYPISQNPPPRLIVISSTGLTKEAHNALPTLLKPFYGMVLAAPHRDKLGSEQVLRHAAGLPWNDVDSQREDIMGPGDWRTRQGMPTPGTLKNFLVIRPALLTDGACRADKEDMAYRVGEHELKGYTISRRDTAHFVVRAAEEIWDQVRGKVLNIAY